MRMSTEEFLKIFSGKTSYAEIELKKEPMNKGGINKPPLSQRPSEPPLPGSVIPLKRKSKYRNKATYVGDIRFDSKKEARRYEELVNLYRAGIVKTVLRQVPFDLPGGIKYRADFQVLYNDGTYVFEDVKGYRTKMYKMKKAQVEALHKIEIKEV